MRRPLTTKQKHPVRSDSVHKSATVNKLVNYVMVGGKKNAARKSVYGALDIMKEAGATDPVAMLEQGIQNVAPTMEVRSRRVGGANYQVPHPVRPERQLALALRWILEGARSKKGKAFSVRLADELTAASKGEGEAMKKRENVHKMAEANKAFAHFALSRPKTKR